MDANLSSSVQLANVFGLDASTDKAPAQQPKISVEDCERYANRIDFLIKESNNHLSLFQPIQIEFCKKRKIFKATAENKLNPHTQLIFDPFNLMAHTAGDFLFLAKLGGYLVFSDAVPYAPLVPHKSAVLHFLSYYHIVPDFVVASPFGLNKGALQKSIDRFNSKLSISRHELEDCPPKSKIKKIIENEIACFEHEVAKLKQILGLSKIV